MQNKGRNLSSIHTGTLLKNKLWNYVYNLKLSSRYGDTMKEPFLHPFSLLCPFEVNDGNWSLFWYSYGTVLFLDCCPKTYLTFFFNCTFIKLSLHYSIGLCNIFINANLTETSWRFQVIVNIMKKEITISLQ